MALPPEMFALNHRYSIFKHIALNFRDVYAAAPDEYAVNFMDPFWDSDQRDGTSEVLQRWVDLQPIREDSGLRGYYLLQADCYERVGTRAGKPELGTPYQMPTFTLAKMVQRFVAIFAVKGIPIYDFMTSMEAAVDTGFCLIVRNSNARLRAPEEVTPLAWDGGPLLRTVVTYRLNLPQDLAINDFYEDGI